MNQFIQEALHMFSMHASLYFLAFLHSAQLQYSHVWFRKPTKECLNIYFIYYYVITSENKRF